MIILRWPLNKTWYSQVIYNDILLSAQTTTEAASLKSADSRIFDIICELSSGNPLAALNIWIDSVYLRGITIEVNAPKKPDMNIFNNIEDDLLFIYASILMHDKISIQQLMKSTNLSKPIIKHAIKKGVSQGFIKTHYNFLN